jgi:hypothetical protein
MKLGSAWNSDPRIKTAFHSADAVIGGVIVLLAVLYIAHRLRGRMR